MKVKCECCLETIKVHVFPITPCPTCDKTEWIVCMNALINSSNWVYYCPNCMTELKLSKKQWHLYCPAEGCNYVEQI